MFERQTVKFLHDQANWIDAEQFMRLAVRPGRPGNSWEPDPFSEEPDGLNNAEAVISLYKGDFLAGLYIDGAPEFEAWAGGEKERLRLLLLKNLETLSHHYQRRQQYEAAATTLRRLISIEPWHEASHRQLMLVLARQGKFEAAMAQFGQCCSILADELDVEPHQETIALYERICAARTLTPTALPP